MGDQLLVIRNLLCPGCFNRGELFLDNGVGHGTLPGELQDFGAQHIQIVNFAEQPLDALQGTAPTGVLCGQKTLDRVTKPFQRDPQPVIGDAAGAMSAPAVQLLGLLETAQSEAREMRLSEGQRRGTLGQSMLPALPPLAGKVAQRRAGVAAYHALLATQ
jgi:hypothetical protein